MSVDRFFVHDVTLLDAPLVTDRYGGETPDWSAAVATPARGWFTHQSSTEATGELRDGRSTLAELSLPASTPVGPRTRVERLGQAWDLYGTVRPAETPNGTHHQVLQLRRVEG